MESPIRTRRSLIAMVATLALGSAFSAAMADPLAVWHSRNSGATNVLNADAFGNGLLVAVGGEGTILTSTDGLAWTRRSSGITSFLNSMVFANNLFVIVGDSGIILTSTNGTSWTRRTSETTDFLYDVGYGNGVFIAVSDTGTVLSSINGVSWTRRSGGTQGVYGVANGNGRFVAVGGIADCSLFFCSYASVAYASDDAVTWTQSNPGPGFLLSDLAFGNGIFVAVGDGGTIVKSTDGMSWTPQVSGSSELLFNVAFGDGTFVVVGGSQQGVIFTSTDGVNWTKRDSGTSASLSNVAYANGTFIAVGVGGTIVQSDPVVSSPKLTLSLSATQLQFSWPAASGVFSIEQTEQLASPSWASTPNQVPATVGDQTVVNVTAPAGNRFYRLVSVP